MILLGPHVIPIIREGGASNTPSSFSLFRFQRLNYRRGDRVATPRKELGWVTGTLESDAWPISDGGRDAKGKGGFQASVKLDEAFEPFSSDGTDVYGNRIINILSLHVRRTLSSCCLLRSTITARCTNVFAKLK